MITSLSQINRSFFCGFFVPVILLIGCKAKPEPRVFETEAYEIAGLEIGMSEADVIEKMGKPNQIENIFLGGDYARFIYQGLTVDMLATGPKLDSPKVVSGLSSHTHLHCFNATICPGDTLRSVKVKMGEAEISPATTDKLARLYYPFPELETCWLWVFTEDMKVSTEVNIACQP